MTHLVFPCHHFPVHRYFQAPGLKTWVLPCAPSRLFIHMIMKTSTPQFCNNGAISLFIWKHAIKTSNISPFLVILFQKKKKKGRLYAVRDFLTNWNCAHKVHIGNALFAPGNEIILHIHICTDTHSSLGSTPSSTQGLIFFLLLGYFWLCAYGTMQCWEEKQRLVPGKAYAAAFEHLATLYNNIPL